MLAVSLRNKAAGQLTYCLVKCWWTTHKTFPTIVKYQSTLIQPRTSIQTWQLDMVILTHSSHASRSHLAASAMTCDFSMVYFTHTSHRVDTGLTIIGWCFWKAIALYRVWVPITIQLMPHEFQCYIPYHSIALVGLLWLNANLAIIFAVPLQYCTTVCTRVLTHHFTKATEH